MNLIVHGVFLGQLFTPHLILWPRPSDTLNRETGKICFMIGKVSSMRRDSLRDIQSKVMEQKPSVIECYCGSCHVYLASTLSTLAVMDNECCSSNWTKMSRKVIECWPIHSKMFPWKGVIWVLLLSRQTKSGTSSCFSLKSAFKIKCNRESHDFTVRWERRRGHRGSQVNPAFRAAVSQLTGGMSTIHHAYKSSVFSHCKCACMCGGTYASTTYNRESIIASLLESREKITWGLS